jgi:hypothetical protein
VAISRAQHKQRVAAASVRSPKKRRAAKDRFRAATLRSLIAWLAETPEALNHPAVQPALDELTEVLVMRAVRRYGLVEATS